jgi:hypothetical protein
MVFLHRKQNLKKAARLGCHTISQLKPQGSLLSVELTGSFSRSEGIKSGPLAESHSSTSIFADLVRQINMMEFFAVGGRGGVEHPPL